MELRSIRYFLAVAEELSFSRAAERLCISQPPLSIQIQHLESELGVMLFQRTKRKVELTEAGRAFLPEARKALEQVQVAEQVAKRAGIGEYGRISIGFVGSATYGVLSPVLLRYRKRYPDVEIRLTEMTTAQQVRALRESRIDVGFLRTPYSEAGLTLKSLMKENFLVALPAGHRLTTVMELPLADLHAEPFILFPQELGSGLHTPIVNACRQAGFTPNVVLEATQMHTMLSLVSAGFGIAIVPECVARLGWKGVVLKQIQDPKPQTGVALAWLTTNYSRTLSAFVAVAAPGRQTRQSAP